MNVVQIDQVQLLFFITFPIMLVAYFAAKILGKIDGGGK
jgi:hypothetical protein